MGWTYSGVPGASALDTVRFLIGDVDGDEKLLADEEILYLLARYPDVRLAAAMAARAIASRFARQVDEHVGSMALQLSQRVRQYLELAMELESRVGAAAGWISPHDALFVLSGNPPTADDATGGWK